MRPRQPQSGLRIHSALFRLACRFCTVMPPESPSSVQYLWCSSCVQRPCRNGPRPRYGAACRVDNVLEERNVVLLIVVCHLVEYGPNQICLDAGSFWLIATVRCMRQVFCGRLRRYMYAFVSQTTMLCSTAASHVTFKVRSGLSFIHSSIYTSAIESYLYNGPVVRCLSLCCFICVAPNVQ